MKLISKKYYLPRGKSINDLIIRELKSENFNKSNFRRMCYIEKISETVVNFKKKAKKVKFCTKMSLV